MPVGDHAALAGAIQEGLVAGRPDRPATLNRARTFSLEQALERYLAIWRQPRR